MSSYKWLRSYIIPIRIIPQTGSLRCATEESSVFPLGHDKGELVTAHAEFRAVLDGSAIYALVVHKGTVCATEIDERRFGALDTDLRVATGDLGVVEQYPRNRSGLS